MLPWYLSPGLWIIVAFGLGAWYWVGAGAVPLGSVVGLVVAIAFSEITGVL